LMACTDNIAVRLGLTQDDILLICSPLGHMTGYAAGVLLGLRLAATLVLQDIWEARRGVALMAEEGITYAAGATPFLSDILEVVAAGAPRPGALRRFLCAGAPIPPVLIARASGELDLTVCSVWGMTEALAGTMTEPTTARQKSAATDGHALTGMEVRVLDAKGMPANPGETGRLFVRGSQMFIGYFKRPDLVTFDADGWFDTGDLAYTDAEGYIRINGRTKDVIIRGGENVPVAEIENLLIAHPAILAAAVVGYPDVRLGERGCAFVVLRPGHNFDLPALQACLAECKMAKQYWPEHVVVAAELPRTPSGKVQKFVLKEEASGFATP
jgi:cyclohexanecarboxylate-CoA ligase